MPTVFAVLPAFSAACVAANGVPLREPLKPMPPALDQATTLPSVSVIVPVKDGARYLSDVLTAVSRQRFDGEIETLVIDSGSSDGSVEIAHRAGARVIEIAPSAFGHGKTRNLGAEQTSGDHIVFLTQDATPAHEEWLAELLAPIDVEPMVGLSFGPHLPRIATSPTISSCAAARRSPAAPRTRR